MLWATAKGPGISPDSVTYSYAARTFAGSGRLSFVGGGALTLFPPGLPVLLGLLAHVGIPVQTGGLAIGVVSVIAVIVTTFLLGELTIDSRLAACAADGIVGLSAATLAVYSMLWTEPLFIALELVVLLILSRAVCYQSLGPQAALSLVVLVSLATTMRDAGIALIPAVAVAVFLVFQATGWQKAVLRAMAVSAASCSGLAIVAFRNLLHGAAPLGPRYPSMVSFPSAMRETLKPLGSYLLASPLNRYDSTLGVVTAVLAVIGAITAVRRSNHPMVVITAFTGAYWVLLWCSEATTVIDPIDIRLASPGMVPSILLAAYAVVANFRRLRGTAVRRASLVALGMTAAIVIAVSGVSDVKTARVDARQGIGYNNASTLRSPLGLAVKQLQGWPGVASNEPTKLYWVTGRAPVAQIPVTGYDYPSEATAAELHTLREEISDGTVTYLAYFAEGMPALEPQQLARVGIRCSAVQTLADGALWHCT